MWPLFGPLLENLGYFYHNLWSHWCQLQMLNGWFAFWRTIVSYTKLCKNLLKSICIVRMSQSMLILSLFTIAYHMIASRYLTTENWMNEFT